MTKIFADIDVSLDGYIAGPNISKENPLGDGGEQLIWYDDDVNDKKTDFQSEYAANDATVLQESADNEGSVIMGEKTFDVSIDSWGHNPPIHKPCFVLTEVPKDKIILSDTSFTFITTGIQNAIEQASAAAKGKNVCVMGGAYTIAECMNSGLLEELHLHVVPILLGDGLKLFDRVKTEKVSLIKKRVLEGEKATHLIFKLTNTTLSHESP